MTRLRLYLANRSAWALIRMGLVVVLVIGVVDFWTGHELSIFILYLAPVMIVSAFGGVYAGLALALAAATVWLIADLLAGRTATQTFIPYWNAIVRLFFLAIVVILQNALSKEKLVARTDHLTGMANRKYFYEVVEKELLLARRYPHPFSTAYIDIDNFKSVNDRYGHMTGDHLLQSVGRVIGENIRSVDFGARLGGDEFGILLPQADAASAREVVVKLQNLLNNAMSRKQWPVTFSFGVATFLKPPESVDEVVSRTDSLMYDAKHGGKNRMQCQTYDA
jgi:diguanylate cyclase (GGDEF)-like protein